MYYVIVTSHCGVLMCVTIVTDRLPRHRELTQQEQQADSQQTRAAATHPHGLPQPDTRTAQLEPHI